jgi:hypothetical protein
MLLTALVAVVAGFAYVGYRWIESHQGELHQQAEQVRKEATEFAQGRDAEQCIAESLARLDRCDGIICDVRTKVFLGFCLDKTGIPANVCATIPKRGDFSASAKWSIDECARRGRARDQRCMRIIATLQEQCEKR